MFMKFQSSAFRQGFCDGFTAPFSLFGSARAIQISEQDVVTQSWREVGEAIRQSMPFGVGHGKTAVRHKSDHHKERSAA